LVISSFYDTEGGYGCHDSKGPPVMRYGRISLPASLFGSAKTSIPQPCGLAVWLASTPEFQVTTPRRSPSRA